MRRKVFIYLFSALLLTAVFIGIPKITSFRYNPLGALIAGILPSWQKNQPPIPSEEIPEPSLLQEENTSPGAEQEALVEKMDDLDDQIDVLSQRINEMEKQLQLFNKQILMTQEEEESVEEDELSEEEVGQKVGQELCERIQGIQPAKNKIIFNEIAWMGTSSSSKAEWMELKNVSGKALDLSEWQVLDKEKQIKVFFSEEDRVSSGNLFLLERTDDNAVPAIKADKIYTGILSNEDEALYLFDENCQLQDEIIADSDWPAGNNSSKRTMERKNDFTWQTSLNPGGTPKAENSSGYVVIPPPGGGGGGGAPPPYPKILISEVQISPIEERFIELYNPNTEDVELTGWYIQRKTETGDWGSLISSTHFEGKIIEAENHFLIGRTDVFNPDIIVANLTLTENNTIRLRNPNKETVDLVGWGNSQEFETAPAENPPSGKSIGRKWDEENQTYQDTDNNSEDFEIQNPTPRAKNQSPGSPILGVLLLSSRLIFSAQKNGENPESQPIIIVNTGEKDLHWTIKISVDWLKAVPASGIISANDSFRVEVSVDISGMEEGNYQTTITIEGFDEENNSAQNSPQEVSVDLIILPQN